MYLVTTILFLILYVGPSFQQFYRGELEPKYSRKTPFRQQTDLPDAVFGVGHGGGRRFGGNSNEEPTSSSFFGSRPGRRRDRDRSNIGVEDGQNSEESGEWNREPPAKRRFELPDSSEVKERFDKDRKKKSGDGEGERERERERPKERRPKHDSHEDPEDEDQEDSRHGPLRLGRQRHGNRRAERQRDSREEDHEERVPKRARSEEHEDEDRKGRRSHDEDEQQHREDDEEEREARPRTPKHGDNHWDRNPIRSQKPPAKVVGLNMQMVAGVYPRNHNRPEIEGVEKRGGPTIEEQEEKEHQEHEHPEHTKENNQKFFRGEDENHNRNGDKSTSAELDTRAGGDSGEAAGRGKEGGEPRRPPPRREPQPRSAEKSGEEGGRGGGGGPAQPEPPKPQIPPFPPFPKFPAFGGFQPFQPDFPSRSNPNGLHPQQPQFGNPGGFAGGPWHEPSRPAGRSTTSREDAGESPQRSGEDRPDHRRGSGEEHQQPHKPDDERTSSHAPPSRDKGADDESTERRDTRTDRRPISEGNGEGSKPDELSASSPIKDQLRTTYEEEPPKREFPTPGRFVTSIRAKKSGDAPPVDVDATISPRTTTVIPSTQFLTSTPNILPTESIKLEQLSTTPNFKTDFVKVA